MTRRNVVAAITFTLVSVVLVVFFVGCGGHGPTLPSPDPGGGGDVIEVEDFIVAADEVVEYDISTVVRVTGRVQIDGAVVGAEGVSITIEAEGDVVVGGTVEAGAGVAGRDAPHQVSEEGDNTQGGTGGSVTLTSTAGDVTFAEGSRIAAGDGGDGGEGLTGGHGGRGGNLTVNCLSGTLTMNQSAGMFHLGAGGRGGDGVVGGEDLLGDGLPEQLANGGGDAGIFSVNVQELVGVELEQVTGDGGEAGFVAWLVEGTMTGGEGGDAGNYYYGVDPDTGESTWPTSAPASTGKAGYEMPSVTVAGNGGTSATHGGAGGGIDMQGGHLAAERHGEYEAYGGNGGDIHIGRNQGFLGGIVSWLTWRPKPDLEGGAGGDVKLHAPQGAQGGDCQYNAGDGCNALAHGGMGGGVFDRFGGMLPDYPDSFVFAGCGGDANARGGNGGRGGACCVPGDNGPGGTGGDGGDARAQGGAGGGVNLADEGPICCGKGGDADARGGNAGAGGAGIPPGTGGLRRGTGVAIAGAGTPEGRDFACEGLPGHPGTECWQPPPGRVPVGLIVSDRNQSPTNAKKEWTFSWPWDKSKQGDFTLGGDNNALMVMAGDGMQFSADNSMLWACNRGVGVTRYDNPLQGGDRAPDLILTRSGDINDRWPDWGLWYDDQRDIIYACWNARDITVWDNASQRTTIAAPDRIINLTDCRGIQALTGDAANDSIYALRAGPTFDMEVAVIDGASAVNGDSVADRVFDHGSLGGICIDYDAVQDIIYARAQGPDGVLAVDNASQASGTVAAGVRIITGAATTISEPPGSLVIIGSLDLLLVQVPLGATIAFDGASALNGNVVPTKSERISDEIVALGAWRER